MGAREQRAIVQAYAAQSTALRTALLATLLGLFRSLGSWRDGDQAGWLRSAVPQVLGAQRSIASLTDAYLAAMLGDLLGRPVRPVGVPAPTVQGMRGVSADEVYARPFRTMYAALGNDRPFPVALDDAARRLTHIAATDVQMARTHAARDAMDGHGNVVGYRRVLTGSTSCALCVVTSTQRYHKADLLPIHPGCDCAVAPIVGDTDPGQVINEPLLDGVHDAMEQQFGTSDRGARAIDYRDYVVTHEHGEIGPILARRGDRFTSQEDLRTS